MMKIEVIPVGQLEANCYLVFDEETKECMVIDPGDEGERILNQIKKHDLKVKYIVNTHGHSDHIGANQRLKEATGAELLIHKDDAPMLANAAKNFSVFTGKRIVQPAPDRLLEEGDVLTVGSVSFTVLHTPGHSLGGICLAGGGVCFTGDTLFQLDIGRTDLRGGSYPQLVESIKKKIFALDDNTVVLPGHGPQSTVKTEREHNPYLDLNCE